MDLQNHFNVVQVLQLAGRLTDAIQAAKQSIQFFQNQNLPEPAAQLRKYLETLELRQSKTPAN